eukprot:m.137731 g.137731  ORF g.137731 m.137731 type:complete len:65 (+) comp29940_c2_seq1:374-568(+)
MEAHASVGLIAAFERSLSHRTPLLSGGVLMGLTGRPTTITTITNTNTITIAVHFEAPVQHVPHW